MKPRECFLVRDFSFLFQEFGRRPATCTSTQSVSLRTCRACHGKGTSQTRGAEIAVTGAACLPPSELERGCCCEFSRIGLNEKKQKKQKEKEELKQPQTDGWDERERTSKKTGERAVYMLHMCVYIYKLYMYIPINMLGPPSPKIYLDSSMWPGLRHHRSIWPLVPSKPTAGLYH